MSPILANSDHWSSVSDHFDIGQGPLVSLVNFKPTSGQPLVNPWSTSGQLIVIIHIYTPRYLEKVGAKNRVLIASL